MAKESVDATSNRLFPDLKYVASDKARLKMVGNMSLCDEKTVVSIGCFGRYFSGTYITSGTLSFCKSWLSVKSNSCRVLWSPVATSILLFPYGEVILLCI